MVAVKKTTELSFKVWRTFEDSSYKDKTCRSDDRMLAQHAESPRICPNTAKTGSGEPHL